MAVAGSSRQDPESPPGSSEQAVRPKRARANAYRCALLAVLVLAGAWRAVIALNMPCLSRDGVTFCWYARDLGEQGPAFLKEESAQQHPLFPVMILATQRAARALGAPDSPWTWQRSGQIVAWTAGMVVVVLSVVLTVQLVRVLAMPINVWLAAVLAAALAALLPLNVRLSADVMSDQVFLAFYLAGVVALVRIKARAAGFLCGGFAGLAFLTRPEGAALLIGGLAAVIAIARSMGWKVSFIRASTAIAAFLLLVGPFWGISGRLTPKKNPLEILSGEQAAAGAWRTLQGPRRSPPEMSWTRLPRPRPSRAARGAKSCTASSLPSRACTSRGFKRTM